MEGKKSFQIFLIQFLQPGAKPEDPNVLCSAEVLCLIQKIQHPFRIFCFLIQVGISIAVQMSGEKIAGPGSGKNHQDQDWLNLGQKAAVKKETGKIDQQ